MRRPERTRDLAVGTLSAGFALAVLLVWIPADVDTAVIDVWRRVTRIGDAMLPTAAAAGILVSGIAIALRAFAGRASWPHSRIDLAFVGCVAATLAVGLGLMIWTGPLCVWIWTGGEGAYGPLRDDAPWKYLGFLAGGTFLTFSLTSFVGHRPSWRALSVAAASALVIAAIYDLPFDDLLLPPNGDF